MYCENYLQADRRGRGFRLSQEQRERVWQALETYQHALDEQGKLDWSEVPRRLWQYEQTGKINFPNYDVLLVDEAQFFARLWFSILQKLLQQQNAHLFVVADPTQGFLGRGSSWKSLGLQARGRSQQLRRSYRTTREILQFASLFYRLRLPQEQEEEVLTPDLLNMPNGAFPELLSLTSPQDEIGRVANEVEAFVRRGYPRSHLLILHANGNGVRRLKGAIDGRLGKDAALDPKDKNTTMRALLLFVALPLILFYRLLDLLVYFHRLLGQLPFRRRQRLPIHIFKRVYPVTHLALV